MNAPHRVWLHSAVGGRGSSLCCSESWTGVWESAHLPPTCTHGPFLFCASARPASPKLDWCWTRPHAGAALHLNRWSIKRCPQLASAPLLFSVTYLSRGASASSHPIDVSFPVLVSFWTTRSEYNRLSSSANLAPVSPLCGSGQRGNKGWGPSERAQRGTNKRERKFGFRREDKEGRKEEENEDWEDRNLTEGNLFFGDLIWQKEPHLMFQPLLLSPRQWRNAHF